jgi:hypothetical protein
MLKSLSTAELEDLAKEETQVVFTHLPIKRVFQIHLASNTSLTTLIILVVPSTSARIAHGHHAQLERLAKTNVGPSTTNTTMSATTTALVELTK